MGVQVVHDDGFHQAQLENYNQDTVLPAQRIVSYHKFRKVLNDDKKWVVTTQVNIDEFYGRFPELREASSSAVDGQHTEL